MARTFTEERNWTVGGVPEKGTNVSTDIKEFQAYDAKAVNENVKKVVELTRGLGITYQDEPYLYMLDFIASAGGITATAKEGLNYQEAEPAIYPSRTIA